MFEFIANTFTSSITVVTQLFLTTVLSSNPWFEDVSLEVSENTGEILCSASLSSDFTESLDRLLMSGENIILHFEFENYYWNWYGTTVRHDS